MSEYISPILGVISEDIYNHVTNFKAVGYNGLINAMKRSFGYGVIRTGILYAETEFIQERVINGSDLVDILVDYGFKEDDAVNITRIFSVNNRLVGQLAEKGFSKEDIVYGMGLKERLSSLGLESATVTKSYALEDVFPVYPVIEVPEEIPPPPPPPVVYRSQATFTYSKGKKKVELRIWYQSYYKIEEPELIDMWNKANERATELPNSELGPLLDSLEPSPGFELNHEIDESEVERSVGVWYGVLIFTDIKSGKRYEYEVL